jgi:hypothetical protein
MAKETADAILKELALIGQRSTGAIDELLKSKKAIDEGVLEKLQELEAEAERKKAIIDANIEKLNNAFFQATGRYYITTNKPGRKAKGKAATSTTGTEKKRTRIKGVDSAWLEGKLKNGKPHSLSDLKKLATDDGLSPLSVQRVARATKGVKESQGQATRGRAPLFYAMA